MDHPFETPLLPTIAYSLGFALLGGFLAHKVRLPPLVGYLLAGIAVGPYSPGFVAEQSVAEQLAEIGVILMMFGVGMHFSVGDLLAVWKVAVPGAILQISAATALGTAMAIYWGWSIGAGLIFGLGLSVASTVVLLRAMESRNMLTTDDGRIAVGWLIVEDLVMIVVLVVVPATAGVLGGRSEETENGLAWELAITFGKVGLFIATMLVVAKRVYPWLLDLIVKTGSRELFTLTVIGLSIGMAYAAYSVFGVKFALAAFFAGLVVHESEHSERAEAELKPYQDVFAALFFVSVGMLFNPSILLSEPLHLIGVLLVIILGKSLAAMALVLALGKSMKTALLVSASLAQIGEFSFILAAMGLNYELMPPQGQSLIVAGALISITLNPILFAGIDRFLAEKAPDDTPAEGR